MWYILSEGSINSMARNPEQNQKLRDERRERILSHALRLFASKGLAATKVSDIAGEAEMSQGLMYHYFSSKEDIYTELIRRAFQLMNEAARGLEALPVPPREKIRMAITQLVKGIDEGEEFARTVLFNAQAGVSEDTPPEARAILDAESMVPYGVIERIMRAGQQDGSIKPYDPRELSVVFWTTIKGLALHKAVYGPEFRAPDVRILTSMFFVDNGDDE